MHSAQLLYYFQRTDHAGELASADARVAVENPVCGDQLVLMARVEEGRITAMHFLARGCVAAIGAAAALCHRLQGSTLEQALQFSREQLLSEVGGLNSASLHAAVLVIDARDRLLEALSEKQSRR